jgi:aryl-alcohol dehydrogenase-like predicted oxidoreductase
MRLPLYGDGPRVHPMCLGTADLHYRADEAQRVRLLDKFRELGGNFYDTAHCYAFWMPGGLGESERTLGKLLRDDKDAVIATKGGHVGTGEYVRPDRFCEPGIIAQDLAESLERLGRDWVHLYYLHRDDPRIPVGELLDALEEHRVQGRIRAYAASNWTLLRLREAKAYAERRGIPGFCALQNQWSLGRPTWDNSIKPGATQYLTARTAREAHELGLQIIPWSPAAAGFYATAGAKGEWFAHEETRRKLPVVQRLAQRKGATPGQIALAYLLNQPFPVLPIIGNLNPEHLKESFEALSLRLAEDEIAELEAA